MNEDSIQLKDVSFALTSNKEKDENFILHKVNLVFQPGKVYAVVGMNGSGKSTLLDIISGLKKPTAGHIYSNEQDIHQNKKPLLRYIGAMGYCVQTPDTAFFHKTVEEELNYSIKDDKKIEETVKQFNLQKMLSLSPFQLSGGQKKVLQFALTVGQSPSLILLDEVTAGLDKNGQQLIHSELERNKKERITVMVTHNLEEALLSSDYLIILNEQKVVYFDQTEQLVQRPDLLTHWGFSIPQSLKICQELMNEGIFSHQQLYVDNKKIVRAILQEQNERAFKNDS